jgi:hypothetical protein
VTTGTVEDMHCEVLPHLAYSPDLAPRDFHLFNPPKEALGGKILRAFDEVKVFLQRWVEEQRQTFLNEFHETARVMTVYRDAVRMCKKMSISFLKK